MTRKEFEKLRVAIEAEKFQEVSSDPIAYGIQRASFAKKKFKRLIAAAEQFDFRTVRAKMEIWKRQLARAEKTQLHFEKLRGG